MEKATRKNLAKVAEKAAQIPFHGYINTFPIFRTIGQYSHFSWDGHEVS